MKRFLIYLKLLKITTFRNVFIVCFNLFQAIPVASELVFKLSEGSKTCDILTDAFERYEKLIRKTTNNYKIKFR